MHIDIRLRLFEYNEFMKKLETILESKENNRKEFWKNPTASVNSYSYYSNSLLYS